MINNKGYVFVPLLLLLLIIVTLTVFLFKQGLLNSVNHASSIQGTMDGFYYNYSKEVMLLVDNFKSIAYGNLSNTSLVDVFNASVGGIVISNNPVLPLTIDSFE